MKPAALLCLAVLLKIVPAHAEWPDTIRLFYSINQKELSVAQKATLDSLNKYITDGAAIHITGFADYLGTKRINDSLSNQRASIVKDYLSNLGNGKARLFADSKGAVDAMGRPLASGEPRNRRVDIIIPAVVIKNTVVVAPVKDMAPVVKPAESVYNRINTLSNLDVGESLSFKELTFLPGRHILAPAAVPYLEALKQYLLKNENLQIEIQGHICCGPIHMDGLDIDSRQNTLSVNRAKYIYDFLVHSGVTPGRMKYRGLGTDDPKVYPELNAEDQNQNRRVVIVLLGK